MYADFQPRGFIKRIKAAKGQFFYCLISFCFGLSCIFISDYFAQAAIVPDGKNETQLISRVIDGDTVKLPDGENVRLIGVNSPELHDTNKLKRESERFGKDIWAYRTLGGDAAGEVRRLIGMAGNKIKMESDVQLLDDDQNVLAYVFVPIPKAVATTIAPDGEVCFAKNEHYEIFLNAYLLKMGFAEAMPQAPNLRYQDLFSKLEKEAKSKKIGIWK